MNRWIAEPGGRVRITTLDAPLTEKESIDRADPVNHFVCGFIEMEVGKMVGCESLEDFLDMISEALTECPLLEPDYKVLGVLEDEVTLILRVEGRIPVCEKCQTPLQDFMHDDGTNLEEVHGCPQCDS